MPVMTARSVHPTVDNARMIPIPVPLAPRDSSSKESPVNQPVTRATTITKEFVPNAIKDAHNAPMPIPALHVETDTC